MREILYIVVMAAVLLFGSSGDEFSGARADWHGGHWGGGGWGHSPWHGGGGGYGWHPGGGGVGSAIVGGAIGSWLYHEFEPAPAPVIVQQQPVIVQPAPVPELVPGTQYWLNYCGAKYQSFDPASGTYLGVDGQRHPCQ